MAINDALPLEAARSDGIVKLKSWCLGTLSTITGHVPFLSFWTRWSQYNLNNQQTRTILLGSDCKRLTHRNKDRGQPVVTCGKAVRRLMTWSYHWLRQSLAAV